MNGVIAIIYKRGKRDRERLVVVRHQWFADREAAYRWFEARKSEKGFLRSAEYHEWLRPSDTPDVSTATLEDELSKNLHEKAGSPLKIP